MVMKASLQLKMGQQLTMTPQLQQAIRLLQLSTLDLQQEIQEALESNPMLELMEDSDARESVSQQAEDKLNGKEPETDFINNEPQEKALEQKQDAINELHESE